MQFAHNSSIQKPTPPDKGSFPLDHDSECSKPMLAYVNCLSENNGLSRFCMEFSKEYLKCRMDNNLMAKEDMDNFGFEEVKKAKIVPAPHYNPNEPIVAGLSRRKRD
ncbi:hypothetical protein ACTFIW_007865 [Dictyostelium discoideum]|uniref:Cytochrome c oxidase assembly protein COX19 n=1 Tax=Dictyostelium discoideum TaxID=44689 RepID=COX19_DICDI|nr:hypothetical protein DDB_G0288903 [Dictyostelium discoideum AX4]Q54IA0.1 RecName: Full=Cytochrome c oxidase assembly protein COX19 [Dictyostelium discoideum]EAL62975.1 hypothetical protein DDB_G0288903 [Dictyostelium discoideum AX4]|eukprot:XP_636479.1 hypothetical protein DDB_G0288903 [Dictyostelium discoideum AX4]